MPSMLPRRRYCFSFASWPSKEPLQVRVAGHFMLVHVIGPKLQHREVVRLSGIQLRAVLMILMVLIVMMLLMMLMMLT